MQGRKYGWAAVALFLLSGCGGYSSGTVSTDGSTSMEKVIGTLGEAYESMGSGVTVTYNPTGSSAGVQAVLDGRCDIGLSSRALTADELAQGLEETVLAYDGIALVVNPQNPVSNLSLDALAAIYTGQITNWQDVGGADGPIVVIGREAGSGTRDGFEAATGTENICQYRQELTASGDVLTTVSQNPYAIGYASLAAVQESVKTLSIDGADPGEDAVRDGTYPVQRPFLLVTRAEGAMTEQTQGFLAFALSQEADGWIRAAGAVSAR